MKPLLVMVTSALLIGCQANSDDLNVYVANVKSKTYPINDQIPTIQEIAISPYVAVNKRKPFSIPRPEEAISANSTPKSCPQPNLKRQKQPLEKFSVDNLFMRGTIELDEHLWALVQVSGGDLHRVRSGYYLGLNHGRILNVEKDKINLLELVPDEEGCWVEQTTQLTLVSEE